MHPSRAGYRTRHPGHYLIMVLSALAGIIVVGICSTFSRPDEHAPPARGNVVRNEQTPEEFALGMVVVVLFFGTISATGMALYHYFGDTEGYTVMRSLAGYTLRPLLLVAGGVLAGVHGTNVYSGRGQVIDWLMLAIGFGLLATSVWVLYRDVVNREFYPWFSISRKDRSSKNR